MHDWAGERVQGVAFGDVASCLTCQLLEIHTGGPLTGQRRQEREREGERGSGSERGMLNFNPHEILIWIFCVCVGHGLIEAIYANLVSSTSAQLFKVKATVTW